MPPREALRFIRPFKGEALPVEKVFSSEALRWLGPLAGFPVGSASPLQVARTKRFIKTSLAPGLNGAGKGNKAIPRRYQGEALPWERPLWKEALPPCGPLERSASPFRARAGED